MNDNKEKKEPTEREKFMEPPYFEQLGCKTGRIPKNWNYHQPLNIFTRYVDDMSLDNVKCLRIVATEKLIEEDE